MHPGWFCTTFCQSMHHVFSLWAWGLQPKFSHLHSCVSSVPELFLCFCPSHFQDFIQQELSNFFSAPTFSLKPHFTTKHWPWKYMMMNCPLGQSLKIQSPGFLIFFNFLFLSSKSLFTFFHPLAHSDPGLCIQSMFFIQPTQGIYGFQWSCSTEDLINFNISLISFGTVYFNSRKASQYCS